MWGRLHPARELCDLSKTLGLVFHTDGVEVFNQHEFIVWSWSSATTAASGADSWDTKFPIMVVSVTRLQSQQAT